jgi:hypothetical protein
VAIDRLSLRGLTDETCERVEQLGSCQQVFFEQTKWHFYLTATLNMTGMRQKALEGEIGALRPFAASRGGRTALKLLWPDIVIGVGVPTVQRSFFKSNSIFVGAGWRFPGTDRVRLTWGYQFTTLEILRAPYMVEDFVSDQLTESDVIRRETYHSTFFAVSFSLASFSLIGHNR